MRYRARARGRLYPNYMTMSCFKHADNIRAAIVITHVSLIRNTRLIKLGAACNCQGCGRSERETRQEWVQNFMDGRLWATTWWIQLPSISLAEVSVVPRTKNSSIRPAILVVAATMLAVESCCWALLVVLTLKLWGFENVTAVVILRHEITRWSITIAFPLPDLLVLIMLIIIAQYD